jgi:hypothetical protein
VGEVRDARTVTPTSYEMALGERERMYPKDLQKDKEEIL